MADTYTFDIEEIDSGTRIDAFIASKVPSRSRSYIQKAIKEGLILVNDTLVKASYKVSTGDEVVFNELEDVTLDLLPSNIPLDIIYQDDDLLVVNKKRGMVVHPSNGHYDGDTLVNALLYHVKNLSSINGVIRPGIVHRIDKDTSGLLVVAKNDKAHIFLQNQLKDKTMYREYLALVDGVIPHAEFDVIAPIGKDKNDRLKQAVDIYHGKEAITHGKVIERFNNYSLLSCRLETGRTHQIRVHLSYIEHPCVGDKIYGKRKQVLTQGGQMLSAVKLSFIHPRTNKRMTFSVDIDDEFKRVLDQVRDNKL